MSKKSGNAIQDAKTALEQEEHGYLRSHGWQYTSSTPGCLWMWVKRCDLTVDPKHGAVTHDDKNPTEPCFIMVDTDTAIAMQRHSCAIRGNAW